MIQRTVLIKLKNPTSLEKIIERSKSVLPLLPGVRNVQMGSIIKPKEYDVVISLLFDNIEEVEAYGSHPKHREYVDQFLKPLIDTIKAYNIELR